MQTVLYHGTWETDINFIDLPVANYNSIGTWLTESPDKANMYGKNVVSVNVEINNPFFAHTDNFDEFFFNIPISNKYIDTNKPEDMRFLLNNAEYIQKFKNLIVNAGYDTIIFTDSKIDLSNDEGTQTVYILLKPDVQVASHKYLHWVNCCA